MAQDPTAYTTDDLAELQEYDDYKYAESIQSLHNDVVEEEEEEKNGGALHDNEIFKDALTDHDVDDPSISDFEHTHYRSPRAHHRDRTKSKSSSNLQYRLNELQLSPQPRHSPSPNPKSKPHLQRRHSESSSESHSSEYRKKRVRHRKSRSHHKHTNTATHNGDPRKLPVLIPLNVNGKAKKTNLSKTPPKSTHPSNPQSPAGSRRSFTRNILSKYKLKQSKKKTHEEEKQGLGISGPLNVQHLIHVEWDDQRKAFNGIPDVWHSKIPQSYTVPTQELPMQFRENRSVSLTQSVLHRAKSMNAVHPYQGIRNHQPLPSKVSPATKTKPTANNTSPTPIASTITPHGNVPINYMDGGDPLAVPLPGPRVFIGSLNKKDRYLAVNDDDVGSQIPDFHGLLASQKMSIAQYLKHIGIDDLNKEMSVSMIRREFFIKMGFSKRDPLINIPRHIQQHILTHLDIKSYLRCCITCSDLASFLDDPIIWKVQVMYKAKVQGTLHKTNFRLRHRVWKATYMNMVKIDKKPSYYDHVWNIVVAGDTKSGQNRLVVSLGRHWRCKLTGLEPVISAVNGTYRFGVDFVIRRVIIRDIIIKLQVWDGGNVMADELLLKSVNIFLILFDLTKKDSFDRTLNIARTMRALLPDAIGKNDQVKLILVGNTTNDPANRVISYDSAKRFANERGLMYIEANTDNTANESINNAFVNLAEECIVYENEKAALNTMAQRKDTANCLIQ